MTLTIAVFSYNRGNYLRNCLVSILRNAPEAVLRIYDDGSDDRETLDVLRQHAENLAKGSGDVRSKHGGLYGNMQSALDDCTTDFLMFLQDDMQIVRPVETMDLVLIQGLFAADAKRAFVCPIFIKAIRKDHAAKVLRRLPDFPAFGFPAGAHDTIRAARYVYADVSIAHVPRLRAARWQFQNRERQNIDQARQIFSDMPYLAAPFAFFCPEVPIFRQRKITLAARVAGWLLGTDVKAFRDMEPTEIANLRSLGPEDWPIAEDFLTTVDPSVRRPFVYQDIKARWWLSLLHRIELAIFKSR